MGTPRATRRLSKKRRRRDVSGTDLGKASSGTPQRVNGAIDWNGRVPASDGISHPPSGSSVAS